MPEGLELICLNRVFRRVLDMAEYQLQCSAITAIVASLEFENFKQTLNVSSKRRRNDFVILACAASSVM